MNYLQTLRERVAILENREKDARERLDEFEARSAEIDPKTRPEIRQLTCPEYRKLWDEWSRACGDSLAASIDLLGKEMEEVAYNSVSRAYTYYDAVMSNILEMHVIANAHPRLAAVAACLELELVYRELNEFAVNCRVSLKREKSPRLKDRKDRPGVEQTSVVQGRLWDAACRQQLSRESSAFLKNVLHDQGRWRHNRVPFNYEEALSVVKSAMQVIYEFQYVRVDVKGSDCSSNYRNCFYRMVTVLSSWSDDEVTVQCANCGKKLFKMQTPNPRESQRTSLCTTVRLLREYESRLGKEACREIRERTQEQMTRYQFGPQKTAKFQPVRGIRLARKES